MKRLTKVVFVTFLAILIIALAAGPVLAATYFGILLVQETSGNSYTKLPVIFLVNNKTLADQGFMDSTGLDTRVQSGGSNIPHMLTENTTLVAVDLAGNSNKSLIYLMGETLTSSMPTIVGYGGSLLLDDDPALELGDNFTVLIDGWWFTDNVTNKNAIVKADAFGLFISDTTEITAAIPLTTATIAYDVNDDAAASVSENSWNAQTFTTVGAVIVHSVSIKVYEGGTPPAVSVNITATAAGKPTSTSFVSLDIPASETATWGAIPGDWHEVVFDGIVGTPLAGATMYAVVMTADTGGGGDLVFWRVDASAPAYGDGTRVSSADQGETWAIDATRDFMFRINTYTGPRVTATDIATGEHEVIVAANITSLGIWVDSTLRDTAALTAPVPDNANDWGLMQNDVIPYADNITFVIDGIQQLYYAPVDIIAGTVLPDRAGADHPGAFIWGENPAGISVNFTSFSPVKEAKAPAFTLGDEPIFITSTPNITSSFTIVPPAGTFPLAGVIAAVANATSTPPQLPLVIIAGFVILAASLSISAIMRQYGSGSIFVKILVIAAVMGVFVSLKNFGIDFWMLTCFLIISVAFGMASKHQSWT